MAIDRYIRPYAAMKLAGIWQDITADVEGLDGKSGISITHGQANQTARISYGSCDFKLNNRVSKVNPSITSRYSPRNPSSDLYGLLTKNIPFRTGIDRLVCNFGSTVANGWGVTDNTGSGNDIPGVAWTTVGTASAFNVGGGVGTIVSTGLPTPAFRTAVTGNYGELEALVKLKVSDVTNDPQFGLALRYQDANNYMLFYFDPVGTDAVRLRYVKNGNGTTYNNPALPFTITANTYYWIHMNIGERIRANVWPDGTGAERTDGGWDFTLYDFDPFNNGHLLPFGGIGPFIQSGVNTAVLSVDYFEVFCPRFYGEIPTYLPDADGTGIYKYVNVEATGVFRRMRVGEQQALDSPVYRMATQPSTLAYAQAYWTGEDAPGASTVSSGLSGGTAMTIAGTLPSFQGESRFPGSKPMMKMNAGSLIGILPAAGTLATVGKIYYRMMIVAPDTEIPNNAEILRINTYGAIIYFTVLYGTGGSFNLRAHDGFGVPIASTGSVAFGVAPAGLRYYWSVELVQNGANIDYLIATNAISNDGTSINSSVFAGSFAALSFGGCTSVVVGQDQNMTGTGVGHIGVGSNQQFMFSNAAINGFAGETAVQRMARLCQENNLEFYLVGGTTNNNVGAICGAQQTGTLEYNLQLAADTDQGILYEPRVSLGVGYIVREVLYNQNPVIASYSANYFNGSLAPVDDDSLTANDATATSVSSGGSARVIADTGPNNNQPPPVGIGIYHPNPSLTVMTFTQDQLPEIAANRVFIGTWDAARFPKVTFNLSRPQFLSNDNLRAQILSLSEGNYLQITNPPSWLPIDGASTVDLMTQGYKETYGQFMLSSILNTTPYGPYKIGQASNPYGALYRVAGGTDIVLSMAVSAADTIFPIMSITGDQRWCYNNEDAESAADFPMDAMIEGERVTISACVSGYKDTFTRTVSPGWGTADSGQSYTTSGGVNTDYTVSGGTGRISIGSTNTFRTVLASSNHSNISEMWSVTTPVVATGQTIFAQRLFRYFDSANYYYARVEFATDSNFYLRIGKVVANVETSLGLLGIGPYSASTTIVLMMRAYGTSIQFKGWKSTDSIPSGWHISVTDNAFTTGQIGIATLAIVGNTNALPVVLQFDNFEMFQQNLTVTRSVNGISKAHAITASIDVVERAYVGR